MTPGTDTATNISSPGAVNIQGNANPQPGIVTGKQIGRAHV